MDGWLLQRWREHRQFQSKADNNKKTNEMYVGSVRTDGRRKREKKTIESYEISFQLKRANVAFVYLHIIWFAEQTAIMYINKWIHAMYV